MSLPRVFCLLVVAAGAGASAAQQAQQRFIACPIYRDTDAGRKSGCWLVDEPASGQRYDISRGPTKPDWNHEVLIEGAPAKAPDNPCGALVLDPVRVSVLPGVCTRRVLPAESFPGRAFVLPARNLRPLSEARKSSGPPYGQRRFYLFYDFDSSFLVYQLDDYFLDAAATYILAANPRRVVITGFAATAPASVSGRTIAEKGAVAKLRAESIAESLRRLGVPPDKLVVQSRLGASPVDVTDADGVVEASRRRVEIESLP
jgi:hypothetical protein